MSYERERERERVRERVPASSLVKHMGGFSLKTLPCKPPLPTNIPRSSNKNSAFVSRTYYASFLIKKKKKKEQEVDILPLIL